MSQKHQEPPDKEEELPNECPSCKTVEEKIVLHISRNKSCLSNIDPELYQKWKKISKRRSKRKYQAQYVASGEHGEAQARYVDTGKQKVAQKKYERKLRKHRKDMNNLKIALKYTKKKQKDPEPPNNIEEETDEEDNKQIHSTKSSNGVPKRCPICNIKKPNILLHIKSKESCYENVDRNMFEEWRKVARKETKRKYQTKFNKRGGHNMARERKAKEAKELDRLERRIQRQKAIVDGKARKFIHLAGECLMYLSIGMTPRVYLIRIPKYRLIEADYSFIEIGIYKEDCLLNEDELHSWLKMISSKLLEAVISLQKVILIPESDWVKAIQFVADKDKENLKETLFRLAGNLQAYQHENTENISIPQKYKTSSIKSSRWEHYPCFNDYIFTEEDEKQLLTYIENILGKDLCLLSNELQDLLNISKEMENLFVALAYTSYIS